MSDTFELSPPARELAIAALEIYEKKAKAATKQLEQLAVATMPVDTVLSRAGVAKEAFTYPEANRVKLHAPLRGVTGDALSLMVREIEKVREKQLALGIGDSETDERVNEARTLAEAIGEQLVLSLASDQDDD